MGVVHYYEEVVWDDPTIVLVSQVDEIEPGVTVGTYTVYMAGSRVVTAIEEYAARQAIEDIIMGFEYGAADE